MGASSRIALEAVTHINHTNAAGVFGITAGGVPYYSYVKVPSSEHALIGVRLPEVRPYLERPPRLSGLEGEIQRLKAPMLVREVLEMGQAPAPRPPRGDVVVHRPVAPRPVRELVEMCRTPAPRPARARVVSSPWERLVLDASGRLVAPNARLRGPVRRVVPVPVDLRGRAL